MRRVAAAAAAIVAMLALTGCEDAQQRDARLLLQAFLRARPAEGYRADGVHCTRVARLVLDPLKTTRFLCTAREREGGDCAWFQVDVHPNGTSRVSLVRRGAGCVLPGGGG